MESYIKLLRLPFGAKCEHSSLGAIGTDCVGSPVFRERSINGDCCLVPISSDITATLSIRNYVIPNPVRISLHTLQNFRAVGASCIGFDELLNVPFLHGLDASFDLPDHASVDACLSATNVVDGKV